MPVQLEFDGSNSPAVLLPADGICSMTLNNEKVPVHLSVDEAFFARSRGLVAEEIEEDSHVEE